MRVVARLCMRQRSIRRWRQALRSGRQPQLEPRSCSRYQRACCTQVTTRWMFGCAATGPGLASCPPSAWAPRRSCGRRGNG